MSIPTVTVTGTIYNGQGAPVSGAKVKFRLSAIDLYQHQYVYPSDIEVTTNGSGAFTATLFANAIGELNTHYTVKATDAAEEYTYLNTTCVVPNSNTTLDAIAGSGPAEVSKAFVPGPQVIPFLDATERFVSFIKNFNTSVRNYVFPDVSGTVMVAQESGAVDIAGPLTITPAAALAASAPSLNINQTWNNAAVSFVGADMNVTDTASAAGSVLQRWRVGGSVMASISKLGALVLAGSLTATAGAFTTLNATVADTLTAQRIIADTGRIRVRPYADAINGAVLESIDTAESVYLPLSLYGSTVRIGPGAIGSFSATGLAVTGTLSSTGNFTVNADRVVLTASAPASSLYLNGSGNLGLGTASPSTKLHLQDNSAVYIQMTDVGDGASRVGQNGTALTFGVDGADGSTERMRINASGNVGIGRSPTQRLDVSGTDAVLLVQPSNAAAAKIRFRHGSLAVSSEFESDSSGNLLIKANDLEQLRIVPAVSAVNRWDVSGAATGNTVAIGAEGSDTNIQAVVRSKGTGALLLGSTLSNAMRVFGTASGVNVIDVYAAATTLFPGLFATGEAAVGLNIGTAGTGPVDILTGSSNRQVRFAHVASAVNYIDFRGASTGNSPGVTLAGSDTNIGFLVNVKGAGNFVVGTAGGTATQMVVSHTASAVNWLQATGAAAGGAAPTLSAQGTDTDINLALIAKGTGSVYLNTGGGNQVRVAHVASAVNFIQMGGGATGVAPYIQGTGSDANVNLELYTRGTGSFQFITGGGGQVSILDTPSVTRRITLTGSNGGNPTIGVNSGKLAISSALVLSQTTLLETSVALTNGAGAAAGTLTNAPAAGNPTKWIPINDNGTTRHIPAW